MIIRNILLVLMISGCSSKSIHQQQTIKQPHYLDVEVKDLTQELIHEQRLLARVRNAKLTALESKENREARISRSKQIPVGFDKKVSLNMVNELSVVLRGISAVVGWGAKNVHEIGRKPAAPVIVRVNVKPTEPIYNAIEQIDSQVGGIVSVRIDPNFETIIIKYKTETGG